MTTEANRLRKAKARITDPNRWTQRVFARDAAGEKTDVYSASAVKWCILGACEAEGAPAIYLYRCLPHTILTEYNDRSTTTHEDIMRLFDCAIEKAESR